MPNSHPTRIGLRPLRTLNFGVGSIKGSVAKKKADLLQWREKNESSLHHEPSRPESF
jgi:hypothetical protein